MLVAFYVVFIVLIDVVTDWATPSVDRHDLRLTFAQIVKERASGSAALTGDNQIPLAGFADVQRHWGIPFGLTNTDLRTEYKRLVRNSNGIRSTPTH